MGNKNFVSKHIGVPIEKDIDLNEDGDFLVRGYFTSDKTDEIGDIITKEATERAIPKYREWGNIRYMHLPQPVAKVTKIGSDDGLDWNEVEINVLDGKAQEQVDNGLLQALSVGILIDFEDIDFQEDGTWVINDYQLAEISLVDHPANYDARLFVDDDKSVSIGRGLRQQISEHGFNTVVSKLFGEDTSGNFTVTAEMGSEEAEEDTEMPRTEETVENELDTEEEIEEVVEEEETVEEELSAEATAEVEEAIEEESEEEEEVEASLEAEEEEVEEEAEVEASLETEEEVEEESEEEEEVEASLESEETDTSDVETLVEDSDEDEQVSKIVKGVLTALKSEGLLPEVEAEVQVEEPEVETVEEEEELSDIDVLRATVGDLSDRLEQLTEKVAAIRVPSRKGIVNADTELPHEHEEELEEEETGGPLSRARKNYANETSEAPVVKTRGQ
jgi:hypothetical protein